MKNVALILLLLFVWTANAQKLKEFHPKVIAWDISDTARNEFEQASNLFTELNKGEKLFEKLTVAQKDLWDRYAEREAFLETIGAYCSWYCGADIDTVFCSSQLPNYNEITYGAANIHDFDAGTAWVEGVKEHGKGEKISIGFPANNPPVTTVKVFNGYMKTEKTWKENSRVKTLKMYVNSKPYALLHLEDAIGEQQFLIDTLKPNGKPLVFTFEIREVYKGSKYDETAISEINFDGTGVHCFPVGTLITMANGTTKPIETVTVGDKVMTYDFLKKTPTTGCVKGIANANHHNLVKIETTKGHIFATDDHPFFEVNKGWCAINPKAAKQYAGMAVAQPLQIGDLLLQYTSAGAQTAAIVAIQSLKKCLTSYTITNIEGGDAFFANGLLVATENIK
jgi:hypothetical protein